MVLPQFSFPVVEAEAAGVAVAALQAAVVLAALAVAVLAAAAAVEAGNYNNYFLRCAGL